MKLTLHRLIVIANNNLHKTASLYIPHAVNRSSVSLLMQNFGLLFQIPEAP